MDMEQILKRVDWIDDERRKDKNTLAVLDERSADLEENLQPLPRQIKDLEGEIAQLRTMLSRIDQFDETILQLRVEVKDSLDALSKEYKQRDEEAEKVRRVEMRALDKTIGELRKEIAPIQELQRGIRARVEEESRINRSVDEVRLRVDAVRRSDEEYLRSFRLLEDGRRQDTKRLTDMQGELSALRKQVDDQRGRVELASTTMRKFENRLNELSSVETERREAQAKFLEEQALSQVERDRVWQDWQNRFDTIEQQTAEVESNLQSLDVTHRDIKRSQQSLDELSQKVERRINELSEIQRLAEDRFRQEWVTFKADDQKRWTNYTLTQDEERGEMQRQFERLADRVTQIEDTMQEMHDLLQQVTEQSEKRLQSLLSVVHEWVSSHERTIGRNR